MQDSFKLAVGLDIGTTVVRCVIASLEDNNPNGPTVVGVGEAPNKGMRKGVVVNVTEVAQAIDTALDAAERMSGHQLHAATVNINGTHISAMASKGVVAVNSPNHEISNADLLRAEEAATVVQLPANREILQVTPHSYKLDDQDNIRDPLGMSGIRLEVDAHVITALSPNIRNLSRSLEMAQTKVRRMLVSGIAAARAVLTTQQMENGVVLVDIGGSTTNIAVFEEGDLSHVAVLPMGGINITNDLAIGLRTDLDVAEAVKLEHARSLPRKGKDAPKTVTHKVDDETLEFSVKDVDMIVEARLDEIFELVDKELKRIDRSGKLPGGAVITGGGANMADLADYAKEKLRLPVRIAKLEGYRGMSDHIKGPEYATAIGLTLADFDSSTNLNQKVEQPKGQALDKWMGIATDLFKRFKV